MLGRYQKACLKCLKWAPIVFIGWIVLHMKWCMPFSETNMAARERLLFTITFFLVFFFPLLCQDGSIYPLRTFAFIWGPKTPALKETFWAVVNVSTEVVFRPVGLWPEYLELVFWVCMDLIWGPKTPAFQKKLGPWPQPCFYKDHISTEDVLRPVILCIV